MESNDFSCSLVWMNSFTAVQRFPVIFWQKNNSFRSQLAWSGLGYCCGHCKTYRTVLTGILLENCFRLYRDFCCTDGSTLELYGLSYSRTTFDWSFWHVSNSTLSIFFDQQSLPRDEIMPTRKKQKQKQVDLTLWPCKLAILIFNKIKRLCFALA